MRQNCDRSRDFEEAAMTSMYICGEYSKGNQIQKLGSYYNNLYQGLFRESKMSYYIDDNKVTLTALRERIEKTDLVPSRQAILDGIAEKFATLEGLEIITLAALRNEMKTPKRISELAGKSGLDEDYLKLLRREIEGYFPKPIKLTDFDWMPADELTKLIQYGIKDSAMLFEAMETDTTALQAATAVDNEVLQKLCKCCSLTRIQWVSARTARMIILSGYNTPEELATAKAEDLDAGFKRVNADGSFYKGVIGLRDVQRLIDGANYVV